ncbi:unnamed protein product, partial [Amoebophrya sp. A25]
NRGGRSALHRSLVERRRLPRFLSGPLGTLSCYDAVQARVVHHCFLFARHAELLVPLGLVGAAEEGTLGEDAVEVDYGVAFYVLICHVDRVSLARVPMRLEGELAMLKQAAAAGETEEVNVLSALGEAGSNVLSAALVPAATVGGLMQKTADLIFDDPMENVYDINAATPAVRNRIKWQLKLSKLSKVTTEKGAVIMHLQHGEQRRLPPLGYIRAEWNRMRKVDLSAEIAPDIFYWEQSSLERAFKIAGGNYKRYRLDRQREEEEQNRDWETTSVPTRYTTTTASHFLANVGAGGRVLGSGGGAATSSTKSSGEDHARGSSPGSESPAASSGSLSKKLEGHQSSSIAQSKASRRRDGFSPKLDTIADEEDEEIASPRRDHGRQKVKRKKKRHGEGEAGEVDHADEMLDVDESDGEEHTTGGTGGASHNTRTPGAKHKKYGAGREFLQEKKEASPGSMNLTDFLGGAGGDERFEKSATLLAEVVDPNQTQIDLRSDQKSEGDVVTRDHRLAQPEGEGADHVTQVAVKNRSKNNKNRPADADENIFMDDITIASGQDVDQAGGRVAGNKAATLSSSSKIIEPPDHSVLRELLKVLRGATREWRLVKDAMDLFLRSKLYLELFLPSSQSILAPITGDGAGRGGGGARDSRQAAAGFSASVQTRIVECYEVERNKLFEWGPPFLPTDGDSKWKWLTTEGMQKHPFIDPKLSREQSQRARKPPFVFSRLWRPKGPWRIVKTKGVTDPEGWTYAVNWSNIHWTPNEGLLDGVRRRKWIREFQ